MLNALAWIKRSFGVEKVVLAGDSAGILTSAPARFARFRGLVSSEVISFSKGANLAAMSALLLSSDPFRRDFEKEVGSLCDYCLRFVRTRSFRVQLAGGSLAPAGDLPVVVALAVIYGVMDRSCLLAPPAE